MPVALMARMTRSTRGSRKLCVPAASGGTAGARTSSAAFGRANGLVGPFDRRDHFPLLKTARGRNAPPGFESLALRNNQPNRALTSAFANCRSYAYQCVRLSPSHSNPLATARRDKYATTKLKIRRSSRASERPRSGDEPTRPDRQCSVRTPAEARERCVPPTPQPELPERRNSARARRRASAARPCRLGATLSTFGLPRAPAGRTDADLIHEAHDIPGAPPQTPGSRAPVHPVPVDPGEAEQTSLAVSRSFSRGVLHPDTARLARSQHGGSTAHGVAVAVAATVPSLRGRHRLQPIRAKEQVRSCSGRALSAVDRKVH
jgi:hypothetical protein